MTTIRAKIYCSLLDIKRDILVIVILFCLAIVPFWQSDICHALTNVNIEIDPFVRIIRIGTDIKDILLEAHLDGRSEPNLAFEWILDGPGKLEGDIYRSAIFYRIPQTIEGNSAQVTITFRVKRDVTEIEDHSVKFIVTSPSTNSSLLAGMTAKSAAIEPTSPKLLLRKQLIAEADLNFNTQMYVGNSSQRGAFEGYCDVLKIFPEDEYAKGRVYEMLDFFEALGSEYYERKEYKSALISYKKYMLIGRYISNIFRDNEISNALSQVQKLIEEIELNISPLAEKGANVSGGTKTREKLQSIKLETFEFLRKSLYNDIQEFEKFRESGQPKRNESYQTKLMDIVDTLRNLESIYADVIEENPEFMQTLKEIKKARVLYEQELLNLLDSSS